MKDKELKTEILIVGGGTGGCAAAMAACSMGASVIMTEVTDWLGGQLTSQSVPPDENFYIESFGGTARYRAYRRGVRQYYRDHYPLTPKAWADPHLNPGGGYVSRLCHEPRVGLAVIEQMLASARSARQLQVLLRHEPVAADVQGDRLRSVTLRCLESGSQLTIHADYILDATELGDLLPLAKVEYVSGAESRALHGELHAPEGPAQPDNVQAISWCFVMSHDPGGEHVIDKPKQYERWRDYVPVMKPAWTGKLLSWTKPAPDTLHPGTSVLFPHEGENLYQSLWMFRQIVASRNFLPGTMPHDVTLVNWPQIDYWVNSIIDKSPEEITRSLADAKQLSLSMFHWMQTEAPRPDGGQGYPGLFLRPDIVGTSDGLAKLPYIRESRRIIADFTITERHVGTEMRYGINPNYAQAGKMAKDALMQAEKFPDSVGIGHYRIDLHPSTGGDNYIDVSSLHFQIPLGALLPVRVENLLAACKNLGVTHITNGCYRLHPVEWNIGEAAGALAAFCLARKLTPREVRTTATLLAEFQSTIVSQGFELDWPHLSPG